MSRFNPMVEHVLRARYFHGGEDYEGLLRRVANHVAQAENIFEAQQSWQQRYFEMMNADEFLPNSPTLFNAGNEMGQLSACFVLPVPDSMDGISKAIADMMTVQKSGGGTGFSFSQLRQKGAKVGTTGRTAGGPVEFMKIFNSTGAVVKQGSKRHGANMAILNIHHPDIKDFITLKINNLHEHLKQVTNETFGPEAWTSVWATLDDAAKEEYRNRMWDMRHFNISVAVTDEFMHAVRGNKLYNLVDPHTKQVTERVMAKEIWDLLVQCAWATGDPGLFFIDRANENNPCAHISKIEATNPCGEQPLMPNEACNLGHINLAAMVDHRKEFNIDKYMETIRKGIRFLDSVVTVNKYPTPDIDKMARGTRRIGLGIMGFADALLKLEIDYRDPGAVQIATDWAKILQEEAYDESEHLAEEFGTYPFWNGQEETKRRNSVVLTIAPTGTTAMFARCSSGIEPNYAWQYERLAAGQRFVETHQLAAEFLSRGESLPKWFVTAPEVPWEQHLRIQAAWQRYIDSAVSKTINMPNNTKPTEVAQAYLMAWQLRLKGITIFRDGCKDEQVINQMETCANCKQQVKMIKEEGCSKCPACGSSYCSA